MKRIFSIIRVFEIALGFIAGDRRTVKKNAQPFQVWALSVFAGFSFLASPISRKV
jgi:hypothetical protein